MTWLTYRLFRAQAAAGVGALVIVAILAAITGPHLAHLYDTSITTCRAPGACTAARSALLRSDHLLQSGFGTLVGVAPFLIGIFWGAPLVAHELETGTFRLAWTQSVTRTRWLALKLGIVGLASIAVAGLLSLLVTWWSSPFDSVNMNPFNSFDQRDIAPIGYAALGFVIGVTAGMLIRRTLPAMAAALVALVGARVAVTSLRPHLFAALRLTIPDNGIIANVPPSPTASALDPRDWIISDQTVNASGHVIGAGGTLFNSPRGISVGPKGVDIAGLGSCPGIKAASVHGRPAPLSTAHGNALIQRCVDQLRIREVLIYQPASRYWAFQWYETAIYVAAALILAGFCFWWVRHRLS
jgi:hypothetical protein